jgi:succinoglycan biosynthesis protein ExoM
MTRGTDHIGVCVCTYKRPQLLKELIQKLAQQPCEGRFTFSIHIVDNDAGRTAETVVGEARRSSSIEITYDVETVQNIALTRNRAVAVARGNFIAFMDDDEIPCDDWLVRLHAACGKYRAEGALGPVRPLYTQETPLWLQKSGICERSSHETGTVLNYLQTRTGNVLFRRRILKGTDVPFPPEMGREGGEDIDFFKRMIARGHTFVWCEEAPVYEHILPERRKPLYYLDKYLRIGGLSGEVLNGSALERGLTALRSGILMLLYGTLALAGAVTGFHVVMRNLVKGMYHLGIACGCLGYVPVRERRDG